LLLLLVVVKALQTQFIPKALGQGLVVREQYIKHFHNSFVWLAPVNLEHQVIHVPNILHPATGEHVRLLDMLVRLNSKLLDPPEKLQELVLVVSNVIR